ncbi:MAG: L,D-transpeptidase family protein [Methyloceanibacter sp.]|uniref:L,D-transpeptidase family protein n=1 Tax=Methyloceanibacter sp. TaxID=1965321 RepID=UPI003D9BB3DC
MRFAYGIAFTLFLAAPLGAPAFAAEPDAPQTLISRNEAIRIAIQERLSQKFTKASEQQLNAQGALVEYYSVPEQRLLWVDETGITPRGKAVMEEVARVDDYGLRASDYELPSADAVKADDVNNLADAEIKISYAVAEYARDARGGRIDPSSISKNLDPSMALPNSLEVIESIAIRSDAAAYLRSFQPDQPQFEALRQKLIELRGGKTEPVKEKEIVQIPDGPVLRLGIKHEQVVLLRKRLEVPLEAGDGIQPDETIFDDSVDQAVRQFQTAHGVGPDGLVGPGTRRMMNQPNSARHEAASPAKIRTVLLNMERWRWLPHDLGAFYVMVNVPEFMLRVVKEGETIHTSRVVVGKTDKQTPIFSNEMQTIVFNPYWNVPNSIKVEEIKPYVRAESGWLFGGGGWNTSVLQRHNLRIKVGGREVDPGSIDWNRIDVRSLHMYQPPGPDNVLGYVKFVFPNKHDVYMHDTPQKFLFAKAVRAESHGCMRVQNPDQLAQVLLNYDQGWTASRVASSIANSYDQNVGLKQKIPVYVTYFTADVDVNGSLATRADLYGHDARMAAALRL